MPSPSVELSEDVELGLSGLLEAHGRPKLLEQYLCSVCHSHLFDDIVLTACGHVFHRECIGRALKRLPKCPTCSTDLPGWQRFRAAPPCIRSMLAAAEVECPQDCGTVCPFERLRNHIYEDCCNTPLRCGSAGCGELLPRKAMEAHLKICKHVVVTCEQCGGQTKSGALRRHQKGSCTHRRLPCDRCGEEMAHCERASHARHCSGSALVSDLAGLRDLVHSQGAQITQLLEQQGLQKQELAEQQQLLQEQQAQIAQQRLTIALEQGEKQHLAAQLRALNQQGGADPVADLQQLTGHLLTAAEGVPERVVIKSSEQWAASGEYAVLSECHNGAPVWGDARGYRIFRSAARYWMLTSHPSTLATDQGFICSEHPGGGSSPAACSQWQHNPGREWLPAPGTSITAA